MDSPTAAAASSPTAAVPAKRGRGRPPKSADGRKVELISDKEEYQLLIFPEQHWTPTRRPERRAFFEEPGQGEPAFITCYQSTSETWDQKW